MGSISKTKLTGELSALSDNIRESADYVLSKISRMTQPIQMGIILGSGLGSLADFIEDRAEIKYADIPHYPTSTVPGHEGKLIIGTLGGKRVLAMKGRFHYYEGYDVQQVVHPIRVMKALGIANLLITNAAGAINRNFRAGGLMLIKDHINLSSVNPLRGKNLDEYGPRFPDMTHVYDLELRLMVKQVARKHGIQLFEGVYAYMPGPSFETPAEIRALGILGADAVGMSTVPEAITASHCGMNIIGISCLCNMAAGILDKPLCHQEVLDAAEAAKEKFTKLVLEVVRTWQI